MVRELAKAWKDYLLLKTMEKFYDRVGSADNHRRFLSRNFEALVGGFPSVSLSYAGPRACVLPAGPSQSNMPISKKSRSHPGVKGLLLGTLLRSLRNKAGGSSL
jgi:hypothetical protein